MPLHLLGGRRCPLCGREDFHIHRRAPIVEAVLDEVTTEARNAAARRTAPGSRAPSGEQLGLFDQD